jgi:hypothetical protein
VEQRFGGFMNWISRQRWGRTPFSPKRRTAICGFVVGASLSLALVAVPLWLVGGSSGGTSLPTGVGPAPLGALSTLPAASSDFDISAILVGDWSGEMCPDEGDPVPVRFEFMSDDAGEIAYSLSVGGDFHSEGIVGSGACDVAGEEIAFHAFLALLNECEAACGVDRIYEGHFEQGSLVGTYADVADEELCASCVGGGSWWLEPDPG